MGTFKMSPEDHVCLQVQYSFTRRKKTHTHRDNPQQTTVFPLVSSVLIIHVIKITGVQSSADDSQLFTV